jgi:signal transduction histidine kinase
MILLFGVGVLLPGILLAVAGFRSLRQERLMAERQSRDALERAAELAARESERELERWEEWRGTEFVRMEFSGGGRLVSASGLAWVDAGRMEPRPGLPALAVKGEEAEIRQQDDAGALRLYETAMRAGPEEARPEILLRIARIAMRQGNSQRAEAAWREATTYPKSPAAGAAWFSLARLGKEDTANLRKVLEGGRIPMTKEAYFYYSEWLRDQLPPGEREEWDRVRGASVARTEAAEVFLERPRRRPADGFVAFWREGRAVVAREEAVLAQAERAARNGLGPSIRIRRGGKGEDGVSRVLRDAELDWRVEATALQPGEQEEAIRGRERIYVAGLGLVLMALASGTWLTARAMRREMAAAQLQSDFVATVSHEFRSPLTGIRQLAELLDTGVVTEERRRKEYYGLILRETGRLSQLVENLLDLSRLEAGRYEYRKEAIDTGEWLGGLVAGIGKPEFKARIDGGLPVIEGDREALGSAVRNLIENAFKYAPAGTAVELEAEGCEGGVTIRVRDQGPGIEAEEQALVFERFYRGRRERSGGPGGAGIGLSLVKRVAEDHGGTVEVVSRVGEGSTFSIHLPGRRKDEG